MILDDVRVVTELKRQRLTLRARHFVGCPLYSQHGTAEASARTAHGALRQRWEFHLKTC